MFCPKFPSLYRGNGAATSLLDLAGQLPGLFFRDVLIRTGTGRPGLIPARDTPRQNLVRASCCPRRALA